MPAQLLDGGLFAGANFLHVPDRQVQVSAVGNIESAVTVENSVDANQVPNTVTSLRAAS
jgi:hypothetical protein